ncbi:MAG: UDP-N-acetylenolpyruvoylglucosamine reductase, partial [Planctomycetota bacterium]
RAISKTGINIISAHAGRMERVPRSRMKFGYRKGPFRRRIITAVVLRLRRDEPEKIKARMRRILEEKLATQPYSERSAGCVFKNPEGESAGALIDRAGLKGECLGGAEVSRRHANFIVNTGRARAGDVVQLIKRIQRRVYRTAGRRLRREIVFLK